jgi:hypothetical protein
MKTYSDSYHNEAIRDEQDPMGALEHAFAARLASRDANWTLTLARLCVLASFIGMSLMVIAAELWWWDNGVQPTQKLMLLMLCGAALAAIAWRAGSRLLLRLEQ